MGVAERTVDMAVRWCPVAQRRGIHDGLRLGLERGEEELELGMDRT